jgi:hypothetical protein
LTLFRIHSYSFNCIVFCLSLFCCFFVPPSHSLTHSDTHRRRFHRTAAAIPSSPLAIRIRRC